MALSRSRREHQKRNRGSVECEILPQKSPQRCGYSVLGLPEPVLRLSSFKFQMFRLRNEYMFGSEEDVGISENMTVIGSLTWKGREVRRIDAMFKRLADGNGLIWSDITFTIDRN